MAAQRRHSVTMALLSWLLFAGPGAAHARSFGVTVQGGYVNANFRNVPDPYGIFTSLNSFAAGIRLGWPVGQALEISTEAMYIEKGISYGNSEATDPFGNPIGPVEFLHVIQQVEVPVLLRWRIPVQWGVRPSLLGGPFVSFKTGELFKATGANTGSESVDDLNDTDYGIVLGASLDHKAGPGRVVLEGRYDLGLADLRFLGAHATYSGALSILAGYSF